MSHLIKNITLHHLITEEHPYCLYCQLMCTWETSSSIDMANSYRETTVYNCVTCGERFVTYGLSNSKQYSPIIGSFEFTCEDLKIHIYYEIENFSISKVGARNRVWINNLDNVEFDFKHKEKLYNKIKTYAVMA